MGSPEAASPCSPSDDFHQAFSNVTCLAILSTCCLETGSDLERMWKGRRQLWAVDADLWDKPKWLGVEEGKEENGYFLLLNWVSPWTRAIQGVPVQVEHHLKILNHFFFNTGPIFPLGTKWKYGTRKSRNQSCSLDRSAFGGWAPWQHPKLRKSNTWLARRHRAIRRKSR